MPAQTGHVTPANGLTQQEARELNELVSRWRGFDIRANTMQRMLDLAQRAADAVIANGPNGLGYPRSVTPEAE
jgi:hypothetical protein